jgi:hypothetical protein
MVAEDGETAGISSAESSESKLVREAGKVGVDLRTNPIGKSTIPSGPIITEAKQALAEAEGSDLQSQVETAVSTDMMTAELEDSR